MNIKNGIIFIWTGTNAGIPSGWSRVTDLDAKYPKGTAAGVDPNVSGGAATHTHTSPTHTHTIGAHTHTITLNAGQGGGQNTCGATVCYNVAHTHAAFTSGAMNNPSVGSTSLTYGACSNDPLYYAVIYITPTTSAINIPSGAICLADAATPTGFNICDGNNSTPDLRNKFLKGAATSGDAGATGGSTTNIHDISHTHTTSHGHASATSDQGNDRPRCADPGGSLAYIHTHTVTPNAATPNISGTLSLTTSETVEPAYTKLLAIKASANKPLTQGIICLWLGNISNIPRGWSICDGTNGTIDMRGKHLKIAANVGEVGATGGSNTHSHAAQTHSHAAVAHTHTVPNATHSGSYKPAGTPSIASADSNTYHAGSTNSVNFTVSNTETTTADIANNEPPYTTVAFIKLVSFYNPKALLLNFIH